jgi:mRNA-degrading endonuclease RelE of RelBE toxin-antitoxin system
MGDYRAIADINQSKKKIEVTKIGHRKNVYKNL